MKNRRRKSFVNPRSRGLGQHATSVTFTKAQAALTQFERAVVPT